MNRAIRAENGRGCTFVYLRISTLSLLRCYSQSLFLSFPLLFSPLFPFLLATSTFVVRDLYLMANALAAVISVTRFYYVRIASRAGNTRRAGADPKEPRKIRRANNGLSCVSLSRNGRPVSDYCTRCARHDALRRLRGSLRREFSVSECYIIAAGRIETSRKFHALNPPGARDRESHASQPRRVFVLSHFPVFFLPFFFPFSFYTQ